MPKGRNYKLNFAHVATEARPQAHEIRKYLVYDVFTDTALSGNPLAVVIDCDGLDTAAMQSIAREFNLSEIGVHPAAGESARIGPGSGYSRPPSKCHLPAIRRSARRSPLPKRRDDGIAGMFVIEENIGPVRCAVSKKDGATFAEFDLPQLPERLELGADAATHRSSTRARSA